MMRVPYSKTIKSFASLLTILVLVSLAGCALFSSDLEKMGPKELLEEGKSLMRKKSYRKAEEIFKKFTERFPNHEMMSFATMTLGDAIYHQGDRYLEADFQYLNFIELYPVHPNVDRAYFYKAMCSYKQMEVFNRDQTNTLDALKNFEIIITQFPKSKYYKSAEKYIKECKEHLAKNLFSIGKYYFNVRAHQSTILRMTELLETYPDFESNDEAFFLIAESYFNEENREKAIEYYREFLKKFPKSAFRSDAISRLRGLKADR